MAEEIKKKKPKSILDLDGPASPFPTDDQLQATKEERRGWINKLREKGLPDKVAKGLEFVSDSITPDTQEDYITQLGAGVGSVGKPVAGFIPSTSARTAASAAGKAAVSQEGKTALSKLARSMPSAEAAAAEGSEGALKGMVDELAEAGTYVKPGQLNKAAEINKIKLKNEVRSNPKPLEELDYKQINNASSKPAAKEVIDYKKIGPGEITPGVKDLQIDLKVANDMGDYKKAKEILAKIRALRGGK